MTYDPRNPTGHMNEVTLRGHLAGPPDVRTFRSGATNARYLVTVNLDMMTSREVNVIPVTVWEPTRELLERSVTGALVVIAGQVCRRFWTDDTGSRSHLMIVARDIDIYDAADGFPEPEPPYDECEILARQGDGTCPVHLTECTYYPG